MKILFHINLFENIPRANSQNEEHPIRFVGEKIDFYHILNVDESVAYPKKPKSEAPETENKAWK